MKNHPILIKFGTLQHILNPMTITWPKIEIFKIQDGGSRHLENAFLAITHWLIVWFQRNFVWGSRTACRQGQHYKNCNFLNPRWRTAAIFNKSLNRHISVKNRPILMKFGTLHQILNEIIYLFIYLYLFFWDSRTGQTGWWIFMRDSLLDMKWRKYVPFGSLNDVPLNFRG